MMPKKRIALDLSEDEYEKIRNMAEAMNLPISCFMALASFNYVSNLKVKHKERSQMRKEQEKRKLYSVLICSSLVNINISASQIEEVLNYGLQL